MNKMITICLVIVGLINFVPVFGVVSADNIEQAYSVSLISNDMAILLRHRALLFGVLGGFIIYAAFSPVYQAAAMLIGGISMVGFAALVYSVGGYNESIFKVLMVDIIGIVVLMTAVFLTVVKKDT